MLILSKPCPKFRRSTSSVSSNGITVSAPVGIGAPVIILIAEPGVTLCIETCPAGMTPITFNRVGF